MKKDSLAYSLRQLMNRNKDGSFQTQSSRQDILMQAAKTLKESGFRNMSPESIKPKHVQCLLDKWKADGLAAGTIKNRMSHVRWWAEKVGKGSMLPKSNTGSNAAISLNLDKRTYIPTENKAREIDAQKLANINDRYTQLSLQMQQQFGLRREEAIKFSPAVAVKNDRIELKASWTKGGRARSVPIRNEQQRALLQQVKSVVGNGALIAPDRNYYQQLKVYKAETERVGMDFNHGLRHHYAQERYQEIALRPCPVMGGTPKAELTPEQREIDKAARMIVSAELGHARESITNAYLGS